MRVNIDESAYNDPRFRRLARLLGCHVDEAIGRTARLWMVACNKVRADHPANPRGLMSRDDLEDATDHRGLVQSMLDASLATVEEDGRVYLAGLEAAADWMSDKLSTSVSGGRARVASAQRGPDGRLLPKNQASAQVQPASQPNQPAGPAVQRSGSGSGSGYFSKNSDTPTSSPAFDFESLYRTYPRKEGKAPGLRALARTITSREKYDAFAACLRGYLAREQTKGTAPKFMKHWSTFVNQWPGIAEEIAEAPSQPPLLQSIPSNWAEAFALARREAALLAEGKTPAWWVVPHRWSMTHDLSGEPLIPVRDGRRVDAA